MLVSGRAGGLRDYLFIEMSKRPKQLSTEERIDAYELAAALLKTWEKQPEDVQIREHDSILKLRAKVRQFKMLIAHRADPKAVV